MTAPSDLLHRRLRLFSLLFTAALIAAAFTIYGFRLDVSRGAVFRIAMGLLLACNVLWWTFADKCLIHALPGRPRVRRALRLALAALTLALASPIAAMLVGGRMWPLLRAAPWAVGGFQIWHMFLGLAMPIAAIVAYFFLGLRWLWPRLLTLPMGRASTVGRASLPATPPAAPSPSRRAFLQAAAIYSPMLVTAGGAALNRRAIAEIEVNRRRLPAPWLPDRLRGLTLTHLSDLHVGRLFRPEQLPCVVDEVNRLDSDLIVVTGDLVDLSNDMLPPAIEALNQLRHRHGLFLCLGNHDLIDDGDVFRETVRAAGFPLLINQRRRLRIGGESLTLAGLDWAGRDARRESPAPSTSPLPTQHSALRTQDFSSHLDHARQMLRGYDPARDGPCIALAHHPHAFDALAPLGVALTLSGHTHGGQLMYAPPHPDGHGDPARDHGIGRLLFRYLRGFYHQSGSTLFVNRGVGNWFPVRINAPAEIVQIQLT